MAAGASTKVAEAAAETAAETAAEAAAETAAEARIAPIEVSFKARAC